MGISRSIKQAAAVTWAVLLAVLASAALASSARADLPVVYNSAVALAASALAPYDAPPGANDYSCRPSAAHPRPVVLLHGTTANMNLNWQALSPLLKNNGYCVFAFNYGGWFPIVPSYGYDSVAISAEQTRDFVDGVLAATGAREVDVVGHSQGGMMPRWYINYLGGAAKVHTLVGLAPSNHGTTLLGLSTLGRLIPGVSELLAAGAPALEDQRRGSAFNRALDAGGDTVPGVDYTVIATQYDEVVTPYTNGYLSGATNIRLQAGCPINFSEHLAVAFDRRALRMTLNALDPATARTPPCVPTAPVLGG